MHVLLDGDSIRKPLDQKQGCGDKSIEQHILFCFDLPLMVREVLAFVGTK